MSQQISPNDFEMFSRTGKPTARKPSITLQKRGTFSLNASARELLGTLDELIYVQLGYNRNADAVLMQRVSAEQHNKAYPVRRQKTTAATGIGTTWIIAGRAFCVHYDIPIGTVRRFNPVVLNESMLVVYLNEQGAPQSEHE